MENKDWHLLEILYETRNITKAAEQLYISQPALTYRLKQLEKEFNTTIVTRGKRGVEFTSQGEYLVKYAKEMIYLSQKTKEYIENMNENVSGTLRLAVCTIYARYELPKILRKFHEKYPQIEINVRSGWSSEIHQMVHKGEVHIGIIRGNYQWNDHKYLLKDDILCLVSKNETAMEDLPNLPQISYETDQTLKGLIQQWWNENYTVPPFVSMEVDRIETCKEMVLNGLGYGVFPDICLQDVDPNNIRQLYANNKPITRSTWMIYRNSYLELSVVKAFVDFLKEVAE
ncbi:LysR family transcriptional regulator [Bacillus taeanensis]|uniref:LysR family transcriptional regulator n=1 Tax=Bacillus taeanensis TaxID=273032 RepID=A0A366XTZ6_9BACI|nr:LysR family transcriptional regulator [Bacillus taeanensis]RBW68625.1 LysR family transcriptional regulator [Bacillus taeanensis]